MALNILAFFPFPHPVATNVSKAVGEVRPVQPPESGNTDYLQGKSTKNESKDGEEEEDKKAPDAPPISPLKLLNIIK